MKRTVIVGSDESHLDKGFFIMDWKLNEVGEFKLQQLNCKQPFYVPYKTKDIWGIELRNDNRYIVRSYSGLTLFVLDGNCLKQFQYLEC